MRNLLRFFKTLVLCTCLSPLLSAQVTDSTTLLPGIFDLLAVGDYAEISIRTDLSHIIKNKKSSEEYLPGEFIFYPSEEAEQTLPVKVKCRGRYRRMKCEFPPLKLKFKKKDLAAHGLNEFNELKLVTHCMGDKQNSRDLILRELLAYQLYNVLTDFSFRAQLVKVTYYNTEGKPKKEKGWGMVIEDSDGLAHRMKGEKVFKMGLAKDSFNIEQEQTAALFNFMIGNTDWSTQFCRNLEFVDMKDDGVFIIPYDFDFAGMVNAPYAVPDPKIGQKTLKDRVYQGHPCQTNDMTAVVQNFMDKKEAILQTVSDMKLLSGSSKLSVKNYLKEFYELLENKESLNAAINPASAQPDEKE